MRKMTAGKFDDIGNNLIGMTIKVHKIIPEKSVEGGAGGQIFILDFISISIKGFDNGETSLNSV
jgi:CDP-diglyceride synthetase